MLMSLDFLFCLSSIPKPTNFQFTVMCEKEKLQVVTFEKLDLEKFGFREVWIFLEIDSTRLINYEKCFLLIN